MCVCVCVCVACVYVKESNVKDGKPLQHSNDAGARSARLTFIFCMARQSLAMTRVDSTGSYGCAAVESCMSRAAGAVRQWRGASRTARWFPTHVPVADGR